MTPIDPAKDPAIIEVPEGVRDRDVFHDSAGRVSVALGYIQPTSRILSYLKYIPDAEGFCGICDKKGPPGICAYRQNKF